jgi:hypothetical protein
MHSIVIVGIVCNIFWSLLFIKPGFPSIQENCNYRAKTMRAKKMGRWVMPARLITWIGGSQANDGLSRWHGLKQYYLVDTNNN